MNPGQWGLLGSVFVALLTTVGSVVVVLLNRQVSPYDKIAERVLALEQADERKSARIEELERRLTASKLRERLRDLHIQQLEEHISAGLPPPPPERPYLD